MALLVILLKEYCGDGKKLVREANQFIEISKQVGYVATGRKFLCARHTGRFSNRVVNSVSKLSLSETIENE